MWIAISCLWMVLILKIHWGCYRPSTSDESGDKIFVRKCIHPLKERKMKDETIAIHAGYQTDPTTKSVAVPIYQTVAYEFDSAQHGADLFNLAVPGNIYTRIMNPTNDVLEQRVAALEGGIAALALSAGSAAVTYSILNLAEAGNNIVTVPL